MKPNQLVESTKRAIYLSLNDIFVQALGKNTPVKSGDTGANWEIEMGPNGNDFVIYNSRGDIVNYLEEGTKSHIIKPSVKKMIRFELKDKEGVPKLPKFKNAKDRETFMKYGQIFYYNKAGIPVLGFKKEGNKYFCFAKVVKHPGTAARRFVRNTMEDQALWSKFDKQLESRLKQ
jgi:hypothetical protein